ncbi:hypothetical protein E2C01_092808 [Portunus trituberculatus]|uniref:Uncharacterized protein n=1 Tax=Portunus trituberculatus TaxID=210409 RepID=A0A5B7JL78_PORTR|nr:hypothetical protein [Portunus trituberculatus]
MGGAPPAVLERLEGRAHTYLTSPIPVLLSPLPCSLLTGLFVEHRWRWWVKGMNDRFAILYSIVLFFLSFVTSSVLFFFLLSSSLFLSFTVVSIIFCFSIVLIFRRLFSYRFSVFYFVFLFFLVVFILFLIFCSHFVFKSYSIFSSSFSYIFHSFSLLVLFYDRLLFFLVFLLSPLIGLLV